ALLVGPTGTSAPHVRQHGFGHVDGAPEMHVHRTPVIGMLHVVERADLDDAGVVDEHVDTTEMRRNRLDRGADRVAVAYVAYGRVYVRAACRQFTEGSVERSLVLRDQRQTRALLSEFSRHHQAESA